MQKRENLQGLGTSQYHDLRFCWDEPGRVRPIDLTTQFWRVSISIELQWKFAPGIMLAGHVQGTGNAPQMLRSERHNGYSPILCSSL